jgi:tetratricopeptide (TPR) repeat protein
MRVATIATLVLATASAAHAETAEELRIRGETLAKDGRYSEAIDAFKAAEHKEHRSRHACLIGLAYERREAYPQAEIYLEQCKAGATAGDPLPEWAPEAFRVLAEALAKEKLVAVLVMASPAEAQISVSTFAPDDLFAARTIHLPPGKYTFTASAPGYANRIEEVEIGEQAGAVSFNLERRVDDKPKVEPSKVPWVIVGGGVALGVAGALVHTLALAPARDMLVTAEAANDPSLYTRYSSKFDRDRLLAIGLYSAGAVAIVTGFVLHATVFKAPETQVAITPTTGGGLLTLSWAR